MVDAGPSCLCNVKARTRKNSAIFGASWQYELDGSWHAFPPEGSEQMNQAYMAYVSEGQKNRSVTIVAGGVGRIVDFEQMTQQNAVTMKLRNIRICTGVPSQWESCPSALLTQSNLLESFYVEVTEPHTIRWVNRILQDTGHAWDGSTACACMKKAEVKSIHRIENFRLWHRYQARLKAMREDHAKCNIVVQGMEAPSLFVPIRGSESLAIRP